MKRKQWLIYLGFAVSAVVLRLWQIRAGFEENGLARQGFLPGFLLPFVLFAAAVVFTLLSRPLPGQREEALRLAVDFRFTENMPAVSCAVAGAFLVMLGGGLSILSADGSLLRILLAAFSVAAALSTLYAVFALYRESDVNGLALLVPVCALVVYLVCVYRTDATDPVLMRIYVEILAVSALTLSAVLRASFVYGGSAPRRYLPVSVIASLLCIAAASEGGGLARFALFAGCAAVELGFLAAADFEEGSRTVLP